MSTSIACHLLHVNPWHTAAPQQLHRASGAAGCAASTLPPWRRRHACARRPPQRSQPSAAGSSGPGSSSSSSSSSGTSGGGGGQELPWALTGRVVREESVELWQGAREALVARAVAEKCGGLSDEELSERLKALSNLLPMLSDRLLLLRADLLAELVGDTGRVAEKMLQLRLWFPTADLGEVLSRRPTLLTAEEWGLVPAARVQLLARFPDPTAAAGGGGGGGAEGGGAAGSSDSGAGSSSRGDDSSSKGSARGGPAATSRVVDDLVTRQPLLLVEDLEELLGELSRLMPGRDAAAALLANPSLADSLACNRALSIW